MGQGLPANTGGAKLLCAFTSLLDTTPVIVLFIKEIWHMSKFCVPNLVFFFIE